MINTRYLVWLAGCGLFWCTVILAFIGFVDPYGVSPVHIAINRLNNQKPKRLDIDRYIKPYEVWRYQPRTVFLGTSRIHESMDPDELDGSGYALAYNAAIPASSLGLNEAHIEQYLRLDKNLKFVVAELFLYNFIYVNTKENKKDDLEFLRNSGALQFSGDALIDSLRTLQFNRSGAAIGPYVDDGGFWVLPQGFDTSLPFAMYTDSILKIHAQMQGMELQPSAFETLDRIVKLCAEKNIALYLLVTPSYPYDDYRLASLGYWPLLESWLRRVAAYPNVLTFPRYNAAIDEPVSARMKYWIDPIHFNTNMGKIISMNLRGAIEDPAYKLVQLTPANVEDVVRARRHDISDWSHRNRAFIDGFEKAKVATGAHVAQAQTAVSAPNPITGKTPEQ